MTRYTSEESHREDAVEPSPDGEETPSGSPADAEKPPEEEAERRPIRPEHLLFGGAGLVIGLLVGYTLAFQIHAGGRPGFVPPARPDVAAMQPGGGVGVQGQSATPPFVNPDGSIDMTKVPPELKEQMERAKSHLESQLAQLEEEPDNVPLMLDVARFYMHMGMGDKGLAYFQRAAETEPEDAQVQAELGLAFYDLGQFEASIEALQRARTLSPDDADIVSHLALSQLRQDRVDDALETLQEAAELDPSHVMSRFNRAVILLFAKHDADGADAALDEAAALAPDDERIAILREAIQEFRETGEVPMMPAS